MRSRLLAAVSISGALSVLPALSCGRDLIQTAYRDEPVQTVGGAGPGPAAREDAGQAPDSGPGIGPVLVPSAPTAVPSTGLSCDQPVTVLPVPPPFAVGEVSASVLVSATYGAGEGPGLWVSARDAYRVYLNGALIAESQSPRQLGFIPLTLLPGDNALAVTVWAESGTPAAAVHLDELSGRYVSDGSWSVETAPGTGFSQPGFDASGWQGASDYGRLGTLPGCDPDEKALETSNARWIGPAKNAGTSAVLRRVIRIAPEGFGRAATGGGAAPPIVARTWEELEALAVEPNTPTTILIPEGTYDFLRRGTDVETRNACPSFCAGVPAKPQFTVLDSARTCPVPQLPKSLTENRLKVGANKTIVGLGRGAQLRGVSMALRGPENIVLRNLALYDVNPTLIEAGDAIGFRSVNNVWIDHVTTKWISDGFSDILSSQGVTLSWMHYDGINPDACQGRHPGFPHLTRSTVTVHHSFFDHPGGDAPFAAQPETRVHLFNNVVQDAEGESVEVACGAQVLLEGSSFETVTTPTLRRACDDDPNLGLISAPSGSNLYLSDVGQHVGADGLEPMDVVFTPDYDYPSLEPAAQARPRVLERAGAGGPWARPLKLD